MKKAQTTTEFLVLLSVVLVMFLLAFALYRGRMDNLRHTKALLSAKEVASQVGRTINQVYKGGNTTFHRLYVRPRLENGEEYNLTIRSRRVSVEWDGGVYQYPILAERVYFQGNETFDISSVTQIGSSVVTIGIGDGDNDGEDEIYAGVSGGSDHDLFEVFQNGSFFNMGGMGLKVFSICVADADPTKNGNEVYVGDHDRHIYQYHYSGGSWSINDLGVQPKDIVAMDCGDGDNTAKEDIYYAVKNENYVTKFSYSGGSWIAEDMGGDGFKVVSIAVGDSDSNGKNEVYAGDENAHIYRYDLTAVWSISDMGEQSDDVIALACEDGDNDNTDELFFGVRNDANLYELISNGSVINHGGIGFKVTSIDVGDADYDPQGYNEIYLGDDDDNIYKYILPEMEFIGEETLVYNDGGVILIEFF